MDHSFGESQNYHRPTEDELLEDYLKVVGLLTINEENRLKLENQLLKNERNEIQDLKKRMNENTDIVNKLIELNRLDDGVGLPFLGPGPLSQANPEFMRHLERHKRKEQEIFKYLEARGIKLPERFYS